ncbi:hypothetical protein BKI52_41770 [marine bacterium AO1-C]|nr:hypothetical protein BKI52_41770 [marine bacterium AO1-C]
MQALKYANIAFAFCWAVYLLSSCAGQNDAAPNSASQNGQGGSLARFTVVNNHLYTVGNEDLSVFDISTPTTPQVGRRIQLDWGVETIFPFQDKLLIGSTTGVYAYDISQPANPQYLDRLQHVRRCDPVVAQGNYAYVTLRGGGACGGASNQLDVIDISDIRNLKLMNSYTMESPYGLGVDGNFLFVCDGNAGLKVIDNTDPLDLKQIKTFPNINAYDVIPLNGALLLIGEDGLFQYRYNNSEMALISSIPVVKQ